MRGLLPYLNKIQQQSGRAYVSRLDSLKNSIEHKVIMLNAGMAVGLGKQLQFDYDHAAHYTAFNLDSMAGFTLSFTSPGREKLMVAAQTKWNGANYSDRIWANKDKLVATLNTMIPQAFVRGFSSQQLGQQLADTMEVSYSNAVRLIRTENRYISNKGTQAAYEASGVVDEFMILATLDKKTSPICRDLDGKIFSLSAAEVGINMPPFHPYCRSTTIPYFPDDDIGKLLDDRVERKDGKTTRMGQYKTYKDWAVDNGDPRYVSQLASSAIAAVLQEPVPSVPAEESPRKGLAGDL